MTRFFLPSLLALCLALIGGSFSADYALRHFSSFSAAEIGSWRAFPQNAGEDADAYARAFAARAMMLPLGSAEGMGFALREDSEGKPLTGRCRYSLEGQVPEARFFTLYPADQNGRRLRGGAGLPDKLFSQDIIRMEDGSFRIAVSPRAEEGNWLAAPEGAYALQLNLYETPIVAMTGLLKPQMPKLIRLRGGRCG